jgi:NADH-quinone oxidoreductase subunit N
LAAALTIFFLSLIGIPPLVGFFGKYLLFAAVIQNGLAWLAIVAIINSVISVGYYVYVVRTMYLIPSKDASPISANRPIQWAISAALVATLLLGVYPDPFVFLVRGASAALFTPF